MENKLVLEGPYANKDFFNFITTSSLPRHQWYYFKEGFSTDLIKEAIGTFPKEKKLKILDPFNGSGTTALTSSLLGHRAIGIEVNPFLHFTSEVKTKNLTIQRKVLLKVLGKILQNSIGGEYSNLESFSTFTSASKLDKWLFNTSVIRRYTSVISCIEIFAPNELKDIFRFSALIAATSCSNVKKDGKGVRYKKDWQNISYSSSDFERFFKEIILMIADDNERVPIVKKDEASIILSDSRAIFQTDSFQEDGFDLVITSPPYLNSFDYTDIYRPELFLGGFVKDNLELRNLRLQTLRSHVQVDWNKNINYSSVYLKPFYDKILENSDKLWNKRIPIMLKAYFDDLESILRNVKLRLNKKGQIWLVVSTSAYAGVHIPVDLIIGELGHELGYNLKGIHCLRYLRTSSQQYSQLNTKKAPLRESLIILEKS